MEKELGMEGSNPLTYYTKVVQIWMKRVNIDVPLKEVYVAICDKPNAIDLPFGDGLYPNIVINWGMIKIGDTHPRPGQTPDTAIETQPKAC